MKHSKRKCYCKETATHGITLPERCESMPLKATTTSLKKSASIVNFRTSSTRKAYVSIAVHG